MTLRAQGFLGATPWRGRVERGRDHEAVQQRHDQRRKRRRRLGVGGAGGAGVSNAGTITTLTNSGAISGGNGGTRRGGGAGGAGVSNAGRSRR